MILRLIMSMSVLVVLALAVAAQQPAITPPPRTITVTGTAERQVPPDTALVSIAVETQAETVARATQQNNETASRVMDAIRRLNITGLSMRTTGFDVNPVYEQPADNRPVTRPLRIIGYRVTNRVEVRIAQPGNPENLASSVGQVLDTALAAGANRVDNVSFTLANPQTALNDALAQATRNARETAQALATAAGVTLGQLMTLSSSPMYQPPMPMYAARAADMASVPIIAGPLTVQVTVTAVYEIR